MSGEDSMSGSDMEVENVEEGANIRVVQSSMHASVIQNSVHNADAKKEKEKEKDSEEHKQEEIKEPEKGKSEEVVNEPKEESKFEDNPPESPIKSPIEDPIESPIEKPIEKPIELAKSSPKVITDSKTPPKEPKFKSPLLKKTTFSHLEEIFTEKKTAKSSNLNVEKRFYEYKEKVNKKIELLKEEQKNKELEICSFQPKTTLKKVEDRTFSHFLHHMQTTEKQKKDNLDKKKIEKEEAENPNKNSFKATLSKGTLKIAGKNRSVGDLHDKLYKESAELKKKKESDSQAILNKICSFRPIVSQKSSELKREGKVSQRLFEEANNKKKAANERKAEFDEMIDKKPEKLISDESQNIIREKFLKEISMFISEEELEFKDFVVLLEKIHFLHSDLQYAKYEEERQLSEKAWTSIGGTPDSKLPIDPIRSLLLSIMSLNKESQKKVQSDYKTFYENRKNKPKNNKKSSNIAKPTFKPSLNSVTEEIAKAIKAKRSSEFNETKPEKVLEMIEKAANLKLEELRKKKQNEMPSECTFQPTTKRGPRFPEESYTEIGSLASNYIKLSAEKREHRADLLYNFSKIEQEKKEKQARTIEDIEIEQNMSECTFTPCLDKKRKIWQTSESNSLTWKRNQGKISSGRFENDLKKLNIYQGNNLDEVINKEPEVVRRLMKMDTLRSYCANLEEDQEIID